MSSFSDAKGSDSSDRSSTPVKDETAILPVDAHMDEDVAADTKVDVDIVDVDTDVDTAADVEVEDDVGRLLVDVLDVGTAPTCMRLAH